MATPDDSGRTGRRPADDEGPESEPPLGLSLEVVVEDGDWPDVEALEALVEEVARAMSGAADVASRLGGAATACVAFSGDDAVRALNARYRGQDKPTNVLSFPLPAPPGPPAGMALNGEPRPLGDIVLACGTVRAEAADLGIPLAHHVQHLVVHGVLHLLGHDHEAEAEAEAMEAFETRILAVLGVADPYRSNE